jgi:large subunit ribosomal protein L16
LVQSQPKKFYIKKMLSPKTKANLKKFRKNKISASPKISCFSYGFFGLQAKTAGILTSRQIESVRKTLKKHLKKRGCFWLNIFPDVVKTKKPEKTRMGKGKGRFYLWCFRVNPGQVLLETSGLSFKKTQKLFQKSSYKISFLTRLL